MSRNATLVVAVVLVLIIGGWFLTRPKSTPAPETVPPQTPSSTESASPSVATNLVTITQSGFSLKDSTIKAGDTVSWMNSDTIDHTVNSAPHPTHTAYPPLNLDNLKPGETKSLMFPTSGTYKYHDHLNPSLTGSVTVQ